MKSLSRVRLFGTPWTVAYQAPQSMEFSRQEYWSGLPFPPPGDLHNPGIEPRSPTLQVDSLPAELWGNSRNLKRDHKFSGILIFIFFICIGSKMQWIWKNPFRSIPMTIGNFHLQFTSYLTPNNTTRVGGRPFKLLQISFELHNMQTIVDFTMNC